MKAVQDQRIIEQLRKAQSGVFSTSDLRVALSDPHPAGFRRRLNRLQEAEVLSRFTRGFYVSPSFDFPTLSQRLSPQSCISFETVLARNLVIGTSSERRILATKIGRSRTYSSQGLVVEHLGISEHLQFGMKVENGVAFADSEKAILDVLYFHLRGRRFSFDLYSDLNHGKIQKSVMKEYLSHYRNPKFVSFAKGVLNIS